MALANVALLRSNGNSLIHSAILGRSLFKKSADEGRQGPTIERFDTSQCLSTVERVFDARDAGPATEPRVHRRVKPRSSESLGLGQVFSQLKRHSEALSAYDRAISLKPELAEA